MSSAISKPGTMVQVWAEPNSAVRGLLWALVFSWLTALAAQITIPLDFTPVPITGQSFAVLLTGLLLGPRLGALAIGLYLLQGGLGLPFFRNGAGGASHLFFAASAGYLWSFPLAAAATGWLAERGWDRHVLTGMAAMSLGSLVILFCGWAWLAILNQSATTAFNLGVLPYLLGDVIKICLAGSLLPLAWKVTGKRSN